MNFKEIKELINLIDKSNIGEIELEQDNFKICIRKGCEVKTLQYDIQPKSYIVEEQKDPEIKESLKEDGEKDNGLHIIKSPIVGSFYSAANPEAEAYVKPGSKVKKGEVLCIIEAMKLMNEITSDVDGEIVEVLAKNQDLVEYGQPLFTVRQV